MNAARWGVGGVAAALMLGSAAFAGDLNPPPGPVNPTDDVVLNAQAIFLPYVINQPGAYRLTSNFVGSPLDGIQIQSDDVWLDLGGFTLDGAGALGDGIVMMGPYHNCTILNGTVKNWGDDGIDLSQGSDNRIINVSVEQNLNEGIEANRTEIIDCMALANGNGIWSLDHSLIVRCRVTSSNITGIYADNGSKVENCTVQFSGQDGISVIMNCLVIECTSSDNGQAGFGVGIIAGEASKVANCTSSRNAADGIAAFMGGLVVDCLASENQQVGIFTDIGGMVTNCRSRRNTDGFHGIAGAKIVECSANENTNWGYFVDAGTTVRECNASDNQVTGIHAGDLCEIENNHVFQNGTGANGVAGIEVFNNLPGMGGTRVSNNDCKNNPTNYLCTTVGPNTFFGNTSTAPIAGVHFAIIAGNDVAPIAPGAAVATSRVDNIIY